MTRFKGGLILESGEDITFSDSSEQSSAAYTKAESDALYYSKGKDYIINGRFDLFDYAATQSSGDSGYGCANRWYNHESVACTRVVSRQTFTIGQTDVPGDPTYYLRTVITDSGGNSGDAVTCNQRIENVYTLATEDVILAFYAKASSSSLKLTSEFSQCFGGSGSSKVEGIGTTKHDLTTSWQLLTNTATLSSIFGKTINPFQDAYLKVRFFFSAGSDWNTITDTLGFQTGTFDLACVKLLKGSITPDFVFPSPAQTRLECARYYNPALRVGGTIYAGSTSAFRWIGTYPKMRVQPTATITEVTASNMDSFDTNVAEANGYIEVGGTASSAGVIVARADVELDAELPTY